MQRRPRWQPYSGQGPWDARADRNGHTWTSSHGSDRVPRLDPATGQFTGYLMPVYYDARKVVTDPSSERATIWLPDKNTSQLIRIEPLD